MKQHPITLSETSSQIVRDLHPDIKKSIRKALDGLSKNPYRGKPLKEELSGLWFLPVAHHRVIYQIEGSDVTVVYIGPRRDVYQQIRELLSR